MKVKYYAIKDVKANEFGELLFAKNDDVAKRIFGQVMSKNPILAADMQLYYIGEFDNESGVFSVFVPEFSETGPSVECSPVLVVDNFVESEE